MRVDPRPLLVFWSMADRTRCVVYKEPDAWSVRIERGNSVLRSTPAALPEQAVKLAAEWRVEFEAAKAGGQ